MIQYPDHSLYYIINIGNSHPVRLIDFIAAIEIACGHEAEKELLPMQPGDVYQTNADTTLLQAELGYKPCTSIGEGVWKTVEWYKMMVADRVAQLSNQHSG